ncbi:hypothetical protein BU17DRAFT_82844 [Hysterangium stoloniferum]|nr:hypothetical protein BU17DRAFT_82844 [Hysterangium stoloniferum]
MGVKKEPVAAFIPVEPVAVIPSLSTEEQEKARNDAIQRYTELRRAFAWSLHRVPLEKCPASAFLHRNKGKILLPRSYRAVDGHDTQLVRSDEDLNMVVYNWYEELVNTQKEKRKGVNYVTSDGILPKRHEYLGPDPRIAGYEIRQDGNIHIRWWDAFLQDPWLENDKWKIDLICDADGQWVEA